MSVKPLLSEEVCIFSIVQPSILIPSEDQQKDWLGEGNREICWQEKSIWKRCFGFEWARFSTALYCSAPKAQKHCLGFKRACSWCFCTLCSHHCPLYCTILHCSHQATAANVLLHALQSTQCRLQSIPESKVIARFANVALFHRCDLICEAPPSLGLLRFPAICAAPALLPCCWWIKRTEGGAVMLLLRRPQPFDKKDYSLYIFGPCDQWDIRVAHWKNFKKWPARSL